MASEHFIYSDERFADLQMLRYRVPGFERLTLRQQVLLYHLSEAALWGRDILWDQNCRYNLRIRRMLEAVGHRTLRLKREGYGPLTLGDLKSGQWRCMSNTRASARVTTFALSTYISSEYGSATASITIMAARNSSPHSLRRSCAKPS